MNDYAVGVDLGGTKVATALVRRDGLVVDQVIESTQKEKGFENVIDRMGASIRAMLKRTDSFAPLSNCVPMLNRSPRPPPLNFATNSDSVWTLIAERDASSSRTRFDWRAGSICT